MKLLFINFVTIILCTRFLILVNLVHTMKRTFSVAPMVHANIITDYTITNSYNHVDGPHESPFSILLASVL